MNYVGTVKNSELQVTAKAFVDLQVKEMKLVAASTISTAVYIDEDANIKEFRQRVYPRLLNDELYTKFYGDDWKRR